MAMIDNKFQTTVHGKCILVGEHAVLRGHSGIVFPIVTKSLQLKYSTHGQNLSADFAAPFGENLLIFFWQIMKTCSELLDKNFNQLKGKFLLQNTIPMGHGMGFSSALCVAVTRWIYWKKWIQKSELFSFAQSLEDIFHGKSSGIDIAGVMSDSGVFYNRYSGFHKMSMGWQPHLYLSSSSFTSSTYQCIHKVEKLWQQNTMLAELLDSKMANSVFVAEKALSLNEKQGIFYLVQAINDAQDCFYKWDLITTELKKHMDILQEAGALAVKPTGSGAGGYVLSLWPHKPETNLPFELMSLF